MLQKFQSRRILEELFNELHADDLADCPSNFEIYRSDVEIDRNCHQNGKFPNVVYHYT